MKSFRNIYILGSHKLAHSYFKEINQAIQNNHITCERLFMVGSNTDTPGFQQSKQSTILKQPHEFLFEYLDDPTNLHPEDSLVPDHTAKHVMYQLYRHFLQIKFPQLKAEPLAIELNLKTPFEYKSDENSILALSYATWTCPADCPEPEICPHIETKRHWDLNEALNRSFQEYEEQNKTSKTYQFFCRTFVRQISHIPMTEIMAGFSDFSYRMQNNQITSALVGTNSHCHGIVGGLKIS